VANKFCIQVCFCVTWTEQVIWYPYWSCSFSSEISPIIPRTNACFSFLVSPHVIIDLVRFLCPHFSTPKSDLSHCLFLFLPEKGEFFPQVPRNIWRPEAGWCCRKGDIQEPPGRGTIHVLYQGRFRVRQILYYIVSVTQLFFVRQWRTRWLFVCMCWRDEVTRFPILEQTTPLYVVQPHDTQREPSSRRCGSLERRNVSSKNVGCGLEAVARRARCTSSRMSRAQSFRTTRLCSMTSSTEPERSPSMRRATRPHPPTRMTWRGTSILHFLKKAKPDLQRVLNSSDRNWTFGQDGASPF